MLISFSRALPVEDLPPGWAIGEPWLELSWSSGRRAFWVILGAIVLLVGLGLIALAILYTGGGAATSRYQAGFLGLLFTPAGWILLRKAFRQREYHAWAGSKGAVLLDDGEVQCCCWQDVVMAKEDRISGDLSEMLKAAVHGENHTVVLCTDFGPPVVFKSYLKGLSKLWEIVERETLPHLLPPAREAFQRGELLWFGAIGISKEGVFRRNEDKSLSWEEVKFIRVKDGFFTVKKHGKLLNWVNWIQGLIHDPHVLMQLYREHRQALGQASD